MMVVFTGGGTGGSVTPLIAIAEELRRLKPGISFHFVGTAHGPEAAMAAEAGMDFTAVPAGKLRRYVSGRNLLDSARIFAGFVASLRLLRVLRPDIVVGAGSFVQVPVAYAAWVLHIPILIHQQDILPGLANRLVAPLAARITVSFGGASRAFSKAKTHRTGNPVRRSMTEGSRKRALSAFGLQGALPTILMIGGGTGARRLNELVVAAAPELVRSCQIIHVYGAGKHVPFHHPRYHAAAFLGAELADAYAAADLVIARAGLATISECLALGKPTIVIPLPGTHQEENARFFAQQGAVRTLLEDHLAAKELTRAIVSLLHDAARRKQLAQHARQLARPESATVIAKEILQLVHD